jgi:halocyanin domain
MIHDANPASDVDRRTVLRSLGTVAIAGALAGCGGDGSGSSDAGGDGGDDSGSSDADSGDGSGDGNTGGDGGDSSGDSNTGGDGGDGGGGASVGVPSEAEEYLSNVDNFDGSARDATGQSSVTVRVGTEANGGGFGYGPAAVQIDTGTAVVWEWTGKGGSHNVVDENGSFESELVRNADHTFEHTFDESGTFLYFCTPHKRLGMKGAVVVE